jgi:acyl carrier protein
MQLAEYMVPNVFVTLEALPLTPNGKVDRKALPAPETFTEVRYVDLANATEEAIAAVWKEVLKDRLTTSQLGRNDAFFEVGGDSLKLLAARRVLSEKLGIQLAATDLFRFPTIGSLADYINRGPANGAARNEPADADSRREMLKRNREQRLRSRTRK